MMLGRMKRKEPTVVGGGVDGLIVASGPCGLGSGSRPLVMRTSCTSCGGGPAIAGSRVQEERSVGQDWCVRCNNRWLQIGPEHQPMRLPWWRVLLKELFDGRPLLDFPPPAERHRVVGPTDTAQTQDDDHQQSRWKPIRNPDRTSGATRKLWNNHSLISRCFSESVRSWLVTAISMVPLSTGLPAQT